MRARPWTGTRQRDILNPMLTCAHGPGWAGRLRAAARRAALGLVLGPALVLAACSPRAGSPPPPKTDGAAPAAAPSAAPAAAPAPEQNATPPSLLQLEWPAGWKVIDQGRAGPERLPVVWYRVTAPGADAEGSARLALAALRAAAGTIAFEDVAVAANHQKAIAQLRGSRLKGALQTVAGASTTDVRVTLEPAL
jgi:hypothetical protein